MNSPSNNCAEVELSLGALVLGALEPGEREAVEEHVRSCARCSTALAELAPMPGLLNRVTTVDLEPPPAPPELLDRIIAAAQQESRPKVVRIRRRTWAVAAAVAAVAALVVGVAVVRTTPTPAPPTIATATDPASGVSGTATLKSTTTGTQVALTLSGVSPEEHCQLIAVGADGRREVAASWVATYEGGAHVSGWTSLPTDQITWLDITTLDGRNLLQLKPA